MNATWDRFDDVLATLRKRWDGGTYLRAYANGDDWVPVRVPLKRPRSAGYAESPTDVKAWAKKLNANAEWALKAGASLEFTTVRSRLLGPSNIPSHVVIPTFDVLCTVLKTSGDVKRYDDVVNLATERVPEVVGWAQTHPMKAIEAHAVWERALSAVRWILDHDTAQLDLRHLDADGVDTKFVETHQKLIVALIRHAAPNAATLSPSGAPANNLAARLGFRVRSPMFSIRLFEPLGPFDSLTEVGVRAEELANLHLGVSKVFVIENAASYLAFPPVNGAIAILGSGNQAAPLTQVSWLADVKLVYWGDIDTHGFTIMHRLREHFPHLTTMLMNTETLLDHKQFWGTEDTQVTPDLPLLTPPEQATYDALRNNTHGQQLRLEQERIRFSYLHAALRQHAHEPPQ